MKIIHDKENDEVVIEFSQDAHTPPIKVPSLPMWVWVNKTNKAAKIVIKNASETIRIASLGNLIKED